MADLTMQLVDKQIHLHSGENTGEARAAAQAAQAARDDILNDAGFQDVAADLAGPNRIGTVAADMVAVTAAADNMAAIVAAPAAAATAVAAAASILSQVPDYANAGGENDRSAMIFVTASAGLIAGGTPDNLVDGATGSNTTDGITLTPSLALAGHYIQYDFGYGARKVVNEITNAFGNTTAQGTAKWIGSVDGNAWADLSAPATVGGSTTQVDAVTPNPLGYRFFRRLWTAGAVPSGSNPTWLETRFKIAGTAADRVVPEPYSGPVGLPVNGLKALYTFDDEDGSGAMLRDHSGNQNHILKSNTATTPNWEFTRAGLRLRSGLAQTSRAVTLRGHFMLRRIPRGSTTGRMLSLGSSGVIYSSPQINSADTNYHYLDGLVQHPFTTVGSIGTGVWINIGNGFALQFVNTSADMTQKIGFGGQPDGTGSRAVEGEFALYGGYDRPITATSEMLQIAGIVRAWAVRRGIFIHRADCPRRRWLLTLFGQSQNRGRAYINAYAPAGPVLDPGIPASYANKTIVSTDIMIADNYGERFPRPEKLVLGWNQVFPQPDNILVGGSAISAQVQFGPEIGIAWQHEAAMRAGTQAWPMTIFKMTRGATWICDASIYGGSTQITYYPSHTPTQGLFWESIRAYWDMLFHYFNEGVGLFQCGLGWSQGGQDGTLIAAAAVYEANMKLVVDAFRAMTNQNGKFVCAKTANDTDASVTEIATINAAQDAVTAYYAGAAFPTNEATAGYDYNGTHIAAPSMVAQFATDYYSRLDFSASAA